MTDKRNVKIGKLHLIFGPMFSGKTSELMRRMRRFELSGFSCVVIKFARDQRYTDDGAATHDGCVLKAISATNLADVVNHVKNIDIIGIDEGQFYPDIVEFCIEQISYGKSIIVAGLDATFKRTPFEGILNLVPMAHTVDKLSAICMSCGNPASFSKRISCEQEVEVIGGIDKYMAVCRECYNNPKAEKSITFKLITGQDSM